MGATVRAWLQMDSEEVCHHTTGDCAAELGVYSFLIGKLTTTVLIL